MEVDYQISNKLKPINGNSSFRIVTKHNQFIQRHDRLKSFKSKSERFQSYC